MTAAGARPKVVIVGAGFAGLNAAVALNKAAAEITLIDQRNHHLFQPLLYQVATAGLSPADIAQPIRSLVRGQSNVKVLMAQVSGIDRRAREVVAGARRLPFDYLILATGSRHGYFGHDAWEPFAPGLKTIEDARAIRRRLLIAFEEAEASEDEAARRALLSFAVIGAGPTGVELAGAIAELAKKALARDFHSIDPTAARIVLIEAGPRVLPTFPESLSAKAAVQLAKLGVEVRTGCAVTDCDGAGLTIAGEEQIACGLLIWAAGVEASPAGEWLAIEGDRNGRVPVGANLSLKDDDCIFVIGDTAQVLGADGEAVPGVAAAAKQMGWYAADAIRRRLEHKAEPPPFRYKDYGNLATIGRKAAVADFPGFELSGFAAWLLWTLAHIYYLIGFRNRLVVMVNWAWSYLTFDRGARLIVD